MATTVHGEVAPGWEHVREVFRDLFDAGLERGAAVSVYVAGERKVHLWGGIADAETGAPWEEHTLAVPFSATKGLAAVAFLLLVDRGLLDLDKPVRFYWPELRRRDQADITVRDLLNHRAGLCAVDRPLTLEDCADPRTLESALVAQSPRWRPGTDQGYGATAWGMYAAALFRRVAGESLGRFLRREVFEPLAADAYLGLPDSEQHRVARLEPVAPRELLKMVLPNLALGITNEGRIYRNALRGKAADTAPALFNPKLGRAGLHRLNEPAVRAMELPWMNATVTADGLARVYAALANGGSLDGRKIVRKPTIQQVTPRQSWVNRDRVMCKPMGFSQGFMKEEPHLFSPHEAAFGHPGIGGSLGFADPTRKLGFGYTLNKLDPHIRSPRAVALCHAVYRVLGDLPFRP
jgi:CubicO group peptidase (beta-lactamase class C family)